jgi:hypothetical protein
VIERRNGPCFPSEPVADSRIVSEQCRENFDCDDPIRAGIAGFVDLAHPAGAEQRDDVVRTEARARGQSHQLVMRLSLYRVTPPVRPTHREISLRQRASRIPDVRPSSSASPVHRGHPPLAVSGYVKVDVALFGLNCRDEAVDLFDSLGRRLARLKTPSDLLLE